MRYWNETDNQTAEPPLNNSYLAAQNPWLQPIAAPPAARVAVARLFVVLALSVLLGGCGLTMRQDVRAYNTCLTRHPDDTMLCEGPRQAYELDPSVVQPRSVASRPVAGHGY
jgi:hypothetical protein